MYPAVMGIAPHNAEALHILADLTWPVAFLLFVFTCCFPCLG